MHSAYLTDQFYTLLQKHHIISEDISCTILMSLISHLCIYIRFIDVQCLAVDDQDRSKHFYSKTNQMHQCIKLILFWNDTLHVSDGLSVHHQEFKTVHTATGICQTHTAVCLLASRQQYLFGCCMYSLELLMMDGKTVRNM